MLLNDVQRREAHDLMDTKLSTTRVAIAASIARHAGDSVGLSPEGRLRTLGTPVYLLHGEGDNIIPSAETLWMASELQPDGLKAVLVSPVLSHLDLNGPKPGAMDQWRLIHFFALLIHAAEGSTSH
jgi:pimeloyl-ACP methyl ester carboxylesterase